MTRILIASLLVVCGIKLQAQPLFTYKKHGVDKASFLRAFYKNNAGDNSEKAMRDYLDLYINFTLKVQAAKDMKLDTLPNQQNDIRNFRAQLAEDYTNDEQVMKSLCREAFERSQKDIRIAHIFIPFDKAKMTDLSAYNNGIFADTAEAYATAQKAYTALQNNEDFTAVVMKYSQDPTTETNRGDLGYITVFTLPYALENIAYNLADNAYSAPYKSNIGYHILKKTGERPAIGKMRTAQILLVYSAIPSAEEKKQRFRMADSLYEKIKNGSDFEALAKQYSGEQHAANTGGLMPDFGVGRYEPAFENTVFALQHDGDITKPFETPFGVHIVKRLKHFPVITDTLQATTLLKDQILQDSREKIAKEKFLENILAVTGYKRLYHDEDVLWEATDSFLNNNRIVPIKNINQHTVLFTVGKNSKTMQEWAAYVQESRRSFVLAYPDLMKQFIATTASAYYKDHLEAYDDRFANQLKEFSDGNLLFEIMERKVWNKAAADKTALSKYYNDHKDKYMWGESAGVIFFTVADKATAEDMRKDIQPYVQNWKTLSETSAGKIIADSARFDVAQIPGNPSALKTGAVTDMVTDNSDGSINFVYILNTYKGPAQKTFEEARGLVINDYQAVLEEKWLAELKKKYPVKINEKVFKTLIKQ